jgi:hypothetical protein
VELLLRHCRYGECKQAYNQSITDTVPHRIRCVHYSDASRKFSPYSGVC